MEKKRRKAPNVQRTSITLPKDLYQQLTEDEGVRAASLNEIFVEAVEHWKQSEELIQTNQVARKIREIWRKLTVGYKNPYQEPAANWRAMRTLGQLDEIALGRLKLDASPAEVYLMQVIEELMGFLCEHDVYCTVTNLRFWRNEKDPNGDNVRTYLRAQETAAARGMRLRRVFLIVKDDSAECIRAEVIRQLDFDSRLKRLAKEKKEPRIDVITLFRQLDLDRQSAIDQYGHFGLIRRIPTDVGERQEEDRGCVVIQPSPEGGPIKNLELLFSEGAGNHDFKTRRYISRFQDAIENSVPLDAFAKNQKY